MVGISMNDEIVRCSICQKIFFDKEFDSHRCHISSRDFVSIPVSKIVMTELHDGTKFVHAKGLDGIAYTLTEEKRKKIHIDFTNRQLTGEKNNRRLNSSLEQYLY